MDQRAQEETKLRGKLGNLEAFCNTVKVGLQQLIGQERQEVLQLVLERIIIKEKSVRIELAIPLADPEDVYRLRTTRSAPPPPQTRNAQEVLRYHRHLIYR